MRKKAGWELVFLKRSQEAYLPSNLCFKKSNSAFCIMSVTCRQEIQEGEQEPMSPVFYTTKENTKENSVLCLKSRSFDAPRSPSVTVQPEPRAAWKAQRRTEECAPSSEGEKKKNSYTFMETK